MGKSSTLGKIEYYNPEFKTTKFLYPSDAVPDGYIKSTKRTGTKPYHNVNGDTIFLSPGDEIPEGYSQGFKNKKGRIGYIDDKGNRRYVLPEFEPPPNWIKLGRHPTEKEKSRLEYIKSKGWRRSSYTNGSNKIYLYPDESIPEGYHKVKEVHKESKGKIAYINPDTGKTEYLNKEDPRTNLWNKGIGYRTIKCANNKGEIKSFDYNNIPEGWSKIKPIMPKSAPYHSESIGSILFDYNDKKKIVESLKLPTTYLKIYNRLQELYPGNSLPYSSVNGFFSEFKEEGLIKSRNAREGKSFYELNILRYIKQIKSDIKIESNKKYHFLKSNQYKKPLELDLFLPDCNLAIEFNGLWSHGNKSWDYHKFKTDKCRENNIQLIHIFEHEWLDKLNTKNKILDYIKYLILPKNKLYARKLKISKIPSSLSSKFLNKYHLQNTDKAQVHYGLHDNNKLYAVMTFCKPRFKNNIEWELSRYCVNPEYQIIGGAERLFKGFIKDYNPNSIVSYCDFSKFTGQVYIKLGFKLIKNSVLYQWVSLTNDIRSRYQCQKFRLVSEFKEKIKNIESKTELEIMTELGYFRVFNSGIGTYIWRR